MSNRERFWPALVPAMVVPLTASLFYFVVFRQHHAVRPTFVAVKLFTLVWPVVATYALLGRSIPRPDPRRAHHWRSIPLGLLLGLATVALMYGLMHSPVGTAVVASADRIRAKVHTLGLMDFYWSLSVFLSVFHSFLEEYYWRWFVYGRLRTRFGVPWAVLLGSVSFAAHHVVISSQFFPWRWAVFLGAGVGLGGAVYCLLYEYQKTLVGAWLAHMLADFGIMIIGYHLITG